MESGTALSVMLKISASKKMMDYFIIILINWSLFISKINCIFNETILIKFNLMRKYTTVLSIAGSDSSAGAGIQADLKTYAALGCYGCSVITSVTAQNTAGVQAVYDLPLSIVHTQFQSIINDIDIDAVKIGMLSNAPLVETIVDCLRSSPLKPVVLDTVFKSTSGEILLDEAGIEAMKTNLFPLCDLIIPNVPEAEILLDAQPIERNMMRDSVVRLGLEYEASFLLKGGHLEGHDSKDYLFIDTDHDVHQFAAPTIETSNTHGTGCTLSSAIAANLAKGHPLEKAITLAKAYITQAIGAAKNLQLGKGNGPVHHFFKFWE